MTPSDQSYRLIPLTQGQFALVDASDYELVNEWKWCAHWSPGTNSYYAIRGRSVAGKVQTVPMHRFILGLGVGDGGYVDHANRDTLDNRRSNLRLASASENAMNRKPQKGTFSGMKGVSFAKGKTRPWRALIQSRGKMVHLGYFATAELAQEAYREASQRLHGDFGRVVA